MSQHLLDSPGVVRPMWRLAIPVLGEQVLVMLVGFVDTGLTGRYLVGEAPLAAIGLMAYSLWLLPSMFAVVSIGATAVVARHTGAREPGQASQAMNQAILCGVVLAGFVMWVCAAGGDRYVTLMNLEGEAADLARRYIQFPGAGDSGNYDSNGRCGLPARGRGHRQRSGGDGHHEWGECRRQHLASVGPGDRFLIWGGTV